jgi:hypothetical protein
MNYNGQKLDFEPCPKCGGTGVKVGHMAFGPGKPPVIKDPACADCGEPLQVARDRLDSPAIDADSAKGCRP